MIGTCDMYYTCADRDDSCLSYFYTLVAHNIRATCSSHACSTHKSVKQLPVAFFSLIKQFISDLVTDMLS